MIHPHETTGRPPLRLAKRPPVTRERVHARTRELAGLGGRQANQVTRSDYERAKREVTGESQTYRQDDLLESPAFWRPEPAQS